MLCRVNQVFLFLLILLFAHAVQGQDLSRAEAGQAAARAYVADHEQAILDEYMALLTYPNYAGNLGDIRAAAAHIREMMASEGIETRLLEGDGAPAIYGELPAPGADTTLMIYIHYDGQPVDRSLWESDPFDPVVRNGKLLDGAEIISLDGAKEIDRNWRIYARSASDDKAPIAGILNAIRALKAVDIPRSVNLKFFLEGEEEVGSPYLEDIIRENEELLAADFWLFLDGPQDQRGNPRVVLGVRGSYGFQLTVYGAESGLHSGHYGNFAPNPIARLTSLMDSMRGPNGEILIEEMMAEVEAPDQLSLGLIDAIPAADESIRESIGAGSREYPGIRYEATHLYPALNFRGIRAGGVGEQSRNVIVPEATASIGVRMVPNQTKEGVRSAVEAHIREQGYHIIHHAPSRAERLTHEKLARVDWPKSGYAAARTLPSNEYAARLIDIMDHVTGGESLTYPILGGSLPLAHITDNLNVPLAILPIANQDNSQHAPNENIRIGHFFDGIGLYAAVLAGFGAD